MARMSDLDRAVDSVVNQCLHVAPGETLVVICNPATENIGLALRDKGEKAGADSILILMFERDSHAAEPPDPIAEAMEAADVVLAPTVQSLSHTAARHRASEKGVRIATLPGVTEEMLARVMSADMEGLRRRGGHLADLLDAAEEARITCPNGSDLRFDLKGRSAIPDAGDLAARGAFGNLPCGEAFIAPVEERSEGRLIVDGSIAGIGLVEEPVELVVESGHLVSASGSDGAKLMELLTAHGPDGTNVAELGIGTNEKAILTGNVLEDEKILGTCHVAFGASAAIGGRVQVPVHLDCVVMRPSVWIGDQQVLAEGRLLIA